MKKRLKWELHKKYSLKANKNMKSCTTIAVVRYIQQNPKLRYDRPHSEWGKNQPGINIQKY